MLASRALGILLGATVAGCVPNAFDDLDRGNGRASDAAAPDAGDAEDAGMDAAKPDASEPEVDAGPVTESFALTDDTDDAIFCHVSGMLDEKLHWTPGDGADGYTVEVGVDSEQCRTGLRFTLPLAPGARVDSAVITLRRVGPEDNAPDSATMRVQVYDSPSIEPFDDAHQHDTPGQHGGSQLWSTSVGGWMVGPTGASTESPELSALVQHVVDAATWHAGDAVTFLVSPDAMTDNQYAQFRDSYAMEYPPVLTLRYR
jgi:hypothetical protein